VGPTAVMYVPLAIAEHTVESLHALHGPGRPWTYWLILAGIGGALASLPLIQVDVAVRAPGLVRPVTDRADLRTTVSGRIAEVRARDNEIVTAGQALLVIATGDLDEQLRRQAAVQAERAALLADLGILLADSGPAGTLQTAPLRLEQAQFEAQLEVLRLAEAKAAGELVRYSTLAGKGIATQQELDNIRYEVGRLQAEAKLFREQNRARWAARRKDEQTALDDQASAIRRLETEKADHVVRAPVDGVLVGFNGWSSGARVLAGQSLGALSPGDALRIESRVSARDIGLVRPGQPVRLQVDAFPYTQWGMLDGVVEAIGADLRVDQAGGPEHFKVLIRPLATGLSLANGVRGDLKKGLTLTARYVVARRSLLQILHDDASAWLNPQDSRNPISLGHP
jgi:multidrug resistance efflux pump